MGCETSLPMEVRLFLTTGQRYNTSVRVEVESNLETNIFCNKRSKINISVVAKGKHSHICAKCSLIKMVSVTLKRGLLIVFFFVYFPF